MKRFLLFLSVLTSVLNLSAQKSPNGKLSAAIISNTDNTSLKVLYQGKPIGIPVNLGIKTSNGDFSKALQLLKTSADEFISDDYTMLTGKRSHCHNQANQRTYTLQNANGQKLNVIVRAYNDGIAFKYFIPNATENETITKEYTLYNIANGTRRWMQQYTQDYEQFFPMRTDGKSLGIAHGSLDGYWGYPALLECPVGKSKAYMLITESDVQHGQCGSQLCNIANEECYAVNLADKINANNTPWRVMIIGSLADIVESTLVTDVATPAKTDLFGNNLDKADWVHPAAASWIYWTYNHGSKEYQKAKDFIDLAAKMKWPYCLIDWEWDRMRGGGNINDAVKYAAGKGIKLFLWYNSSTNWIGEGGPNPMYRLNQSGRRRQEFDWLKENGIDGIKIDFFKNDEMAQMNYYLDILEDAAKAKMLITFHGATLPRGWQRTYPNLMTTEAVRGAEWYNNTPEFTNKAACHNATLPFTRNVVGSMDYTPGTFSNSQHPHITTPAHELALYFLFESAVQHCPDRPDVYNRMSADVRQLLTALPTTWDDTKLLAGYPGEYVVIARRKGNTWYISGVNGTEQTNKITLSLKSLGVNGKPMIVYSDADGSADKDVTDVSLINVSKVQKAPKVATINVCKRGGFVIKI